MCGMVSNRPEVPKNLPKSTYSSPGGKRRTTSELELLKPGSLFVKKIHGCINRKGVSRSDMKSRSSGVGEISILREVVNGFAVGTERKPHPGLIGVWRQSLLKVPRQGGGQGRVNFEEGTGPGVRASVGGGKQTKTGGEGADMCRT